MRPRFWYCSFCGYMFMDRGWDTFERPAGDTFNRKCPMCGEEATPCWECIFTGDFSEDWCDPCEERPGCWASFKRDRLGS